MAFDFPNAPTVGQTYQGYVWDGEKWVSISAPAAPNQSGVISIQVFTTSGQYIPSANMTTCVIECVGGGGGGGGVTGATSNAFSSGGGGAGAYARKTATAATIGISQTVTIGAAGPPGSGSVSGTAGGTTSVGSLCSAAGGIGGGYAATGAAGAGGVGGFTGVGDIVGSGMTGGSGWNIGGTTINALAGYGGSSSFGSGGGQASGVGSSASGRGAGGSGCSVYNSAAGQTGGSGTPGLVIVTEYGMTALSAATAQLGSVRYDLPQGLSANQTAQARANISVTKQNYIINGAFRIQQDTTYVSGAVLAAGAYGHDQWKAGASGGDYTFTQLKSSTTITIAAGKSLIQPIEDIRVAGGGSYVLAWTGTAQARAGVNTLTPAGSYAASPLLITGQTDGTVMSVEFNAGTLGNVSLTEGNVAPPFQVPDYASELALCKRYFYNGIPKLAGVAISAVSASRLGGNHPVIMRAAPTVAIITALPIQTASGGTATVTGIGTNYSTAGTLEFDGVSSSLPGGFVHTYQGAGGNISVNARL